MKTSLPLFFLIIWSLVLVSCKEESKPLNEDFYAIGIAGNSYELELENGVFMRIHSFNYILFIYHDSLFQVEIKDKQSIYSYLKSGRAPKENFQSIMNTYGKTSLKEQLKSMHKNGYIGTCAPECYFLSGNDKTMNFGFFQYEDYSKWERRYSNKKIVLDQNHFPKIYQTIYHTLNSKQWDYFMSNDYYYKDVRTYRKALFLKPD